MTLTLWSDMSKSAGNHDWYLADSLVALGNELNKAFPRRDCSSDGAIGDASHQARKSEHNPDWDAGGVVRAIDIDKDGIDVNAVLRALIGDQRVWYVIWDGFIYSVTYNWAKRKYTGADPHTGHIHVSIRKTKEAETDRRTWLTVNTPPPLDPDEEELMGAKDEILAQIAGVKDYQRICTIQIQNNTRQLLNNAVAALKDYQQQMTVAANNFVRQTDEKTDQERQDELNEAMAKAQENFNAKIDELKNTTLEVPEPPQDHLADK